MICNNCGKECFNILTEGVKYPGISSCCKVPIVNEQVKPIFENAEEASEFIIRCIPANTTVEREVIFMHMKNEGYIKKSAVEEAEEMYKQGLNKVDLVELQHKAIQELKAEIEVLYDEDND